MTFKAELPTDLGAEMSWHHTELRTRTTHGALVQRLEPDGWRLSLPAGPAGRYRLAQLDDYADLPRRRFPWVPPVRMTLLARASASSLPGTWGFGFWNDPFGMGVFAGGSGLRLPALPNSCWFFFASPPNYLSLRDDLPALGALAATFRAKHLLPLIVAPGVLALPLLALKPTARLLRRLARRLIDQDAATLRVDTTELHEYQLEWRKETVHFRVDGESALVTSISPVGPLGLVIWVDNQYAAFPPDGRLRYGTLETFDPTWIELLEFSLVEPGTDEQGSE